MAVIFDIRRFSVHDGPGIRTTVFLKGCPLSCKWCHNPESRNPEPECIIRNQRVGNELFQTNDLVGKEYSKEMVMKEILADRTFYEESDGGVTFSGGEPLLQSEFLLEILQSCKKELILTAVDTCGYAEMADIEKIAPYTDLFLFDIKQADPDKHLSGTGVSNERILENLFLIYALKKDIIIRIPMISSWNTDKDNLEKTMLILEKIRSGIKRVDLLPYHSLGKSKSEALQRLHCAYPETSAVDLGLWQNRLSENGFLTIVGG